ncbi:MAG: flagellar assembly protein FliH [Burkholderiaceae bacterium]|nr:flagellar assembly protein FliH [Burkholderiaceae bacterium]
MTSFGDDRPSAVAKRAPLAAPAPQAEPELELDLTPSISEEEIDELRERARADGYEQGWANGREEGLASGREEGLNAGHEDGHEDGYAAGLAAGQTAGLAEAHAQGRAAAAAELEHVRAMAQQFGEALTHADQLIANDVLELALHLARGMLGGALRARPELILPVVRKAIDALPSLQLPAELALNPQDAKVVREGIGEELEKDGWRIVEDAHVGRGGCRIDTASNQIDAQAATRWQRLTHGLGKDLEWLEP